MLENTQLALIATVHKLYSMVRNSQEWDLGEPELNDRGQPVIHNIAQKLGCIRPNSDIDLPVHSVFPEDEADMAGLAIQLEQQQRETELRKGSRDSDSMSSSNRNDRASSSELDHSDYEKDYRKEAFGSGDRARRPAGLSLSPQSFTTSNEFELPATSAELDGSNAMFPLQSPRGGPAYQTWSQPQANQMTMQYLQQSGALRNMDMLSQGLLESEFGTIKPHVLSCANPEVMMGMGDPMMYSGFEGDSMPL